MRSRHGTLACIVGFALALGAGVAPAARACDACLEDKIAATYDWQVVAAATQHGHTVVFTAIAGPVSRSEAGLAAALARAVAATPGVDRGTVRVSLSPPAVSFACERRAATATAAAASRRLRARGLSLAIVRVGAPGASAKVAAAKVAAAAPR